MPLSREPDNEWWKEEKASKWLADVFRQFYKNLSLPNPFNKNRFYELIWYMKPEEIKKEVVDKLDVINNFFRYG